MPLFHCNDCHHEFEFIPQFDYSVGDDWSILLKEVERPKCDWCGGDTYVLQDKTPLEKMFDDDKYKKMIEQCVESDWKRKNDNS